MESRVEAEIPSAGDEPIFQGRTIRSWAESAGNAEGEASARAAEVLVQLGMELAAALPVVAPILERQRGASRARTAVLLGRLGARLRAVIPRFRAALRTVVLTDADEAVRTSALHALTLLGAASTSQVPALLEALRDELPATRAAGTTTRSSGPWRNPALRGRICVPASL